MNAQRGLMLWSVACVLIASAGAIVATSILLDAPAKDLVALGATLVGTGLAGLCVAVLVCRWEGRLGVRVQLAVSAAVGFALLVVNVSVAGGLMFLSPHDLRLLFVLCGYALIATNGPASLMSAGLGRRVRMLEQATRQVAEGALETRVQVAGRDEVARLGDGFNAMAVALEAAQHQREDLERARRELFIAISHDLRTPLASIRAMVEAMSDGVVTDEPTRQRYLNTTNSEVARLSLLIDDLFELTTIESGQLRLHLESLRIDALVAEAADAFQTQIERAGIHLSVELAAITAPVLGDPQRLNRVLYNLIQNAIRHTPADGTITMRAEPAGDGVRIVVSDTGDGIAPEDLPFVFERFYRGEKSRSRETGGSGLGLSIARGIVEAHGGTMHAESTAGAGASISFTLPASA